MWMSARWFTWNVETIFSKKYQKYFKMLSAAALIGDLRVRAGKKINDVKPRYLLALLAEKQ